VALPPGTRLGPFEVTAQIGVGGMGEVYRATDTNLKRPVAIKVLPESVATDADRLARFQREAEVLAALNHPNIAAIYGLERSGSIVALVMELVDGPTLSDRIAQGPLAVDEALSIANQIAEALAAAHEQVIVHRDLKPANVKVRSDGTVKVLDFGLAKVTEPAVTVSSAGLSLSPTITTPAMTQVGMILGTAAYMSPEQAKGRAADKRSDLWAFGCVLFEMLTGKRAFEGDDISDTLATVLKSEPDWSALPADVRQPVRTLLMSCLTKDRRERLADIAGALFILKHQTALASVPGETALQAASSKRQPLWRRAWPAVAATVIVGLAAGVLGWMLRPDPPDRVVSRFGITLPNGEIFTAPGRHLVAIAHDGSRFVYVAENRLNLRLLDHLEATTIRGTDGAAPTAGRAPFFSPDGQWVGFWAGGQLTKIAVAGGGAVTLCNLDAAPLGADWTSDETILFAQGNGIWRVSANGGVPEQILKAEDGRRAMSPQLLPGGRAVLFTLTRQASWDEAEIVVQPLDGGPRQSITVGTDARYISSGHILYAVRGAILAMPFDVGALKTTGGPVSVVEGVARAPIAQSGAAHFAVSRDGTLVYVTSYSSSTDVPRELTWVDRQGREDPIDAPTRPYLYPRLSPDGTRIASDVTGQNRDIWIWDLTRKAETRLTTDPAQDRSPTWMPDGKRVIYTSDRKGSPNLFWGAADAVKEAEQLTTGLDSHFAHSISPDGKRLVLRRNREGNTSGADLMMLVLDGSKLEELIVTSSAEYNGEISPDGRWLAYQTDRSGRFEIFVRPFPDVRGGEWPISSGGGTEPLWSRNTPELFYRAPNGAVMSVDVVPGESWKAETPKQVLAGEGYFLEPNGNPYRTYDVSLDGRKFLMLKNAPVAENARTMPHLIVVKNWFEELRQRVPSR